MLTASARDRFNFPMSIDRLSKGVGVATGTRGGAGICGASEKKNEKKRNKKIEIKKNKENRV